MLVEDGGEGAVEADAAGVCRLDDFVVAGAQPETGDLGTLGASADGVWGEDAGSV